MKNKPFFIFFLLFSSLFISSCDIFDSCSSSNSYEMRCNGVVLEQCSYRNSSYGWYRYRDCSEDCPVETGAQPSCFRKSCSCSVPENFACENGGTYRCNGANAEKCTGLTVYDGAIWENLKNCENSFTADEIVESGSCLSNNEYYEPRCVPKIRKGFRGKWRRLDREKNYYLGTNGVTEDSYGSQVALAKITKIDDNMLEITAENETFRLVRNSIGDAVLKLKVKSAFNPARSLNSGGVGGIDVIVENTQDSGETYEKQSGSDGNTEFEGMVSGEYDISVGGTKVRQNISDYLNAGNFYFAESGYIYKVLLSDPSAVFYSEDRNDPDKGNRYDMNIRVYNAGNADASATTISLQTSDETVRITAKDEILGTIEPGKYVSYGFVMETIPFAQVSFLKNEIYHDAELAVLLKDIHGETWEDVVTVRIYRKSVPIYLHSTMSNPFILLSPHREIANMSSVVWVPYRPDAKYKLIAQSLTLNTEGVYSIGVGSWDDERWNSDRETFTDVSNFEPNDMESHAKTINMNSQTTSYLHKNDLDFWIIDMGK